MNKKRKEKNLMEKETLDDLKEFKNFLTEGKVILDKATTDLELEEALSIFNKLISKTASGSQVPHANQLYHMRGLCYFKLKRLELAEKDFQ